MNPKIIAISGSTKKQSSNLGLIHAIKNLYADRIEVIVFDQIINIPQFSPDLDNENPPREVAEFRALLKSADGILICTPEYAMGVPGTLKNAIDWTVSSMEFSHKPVALITASSMGEKGHASLLETLKIIESNIPDSSQLLISYVKTKIRDNQIINIETEEAVRKVVDSLVQVLSSKF